MHVSLIREVEDRTQQTTPADAIVQRSPLGWRVGARANFLGNRREAARRPKPNIDTGGEFTRSIDKPESEQAGSPARPQSALPGGRDEFATSVNTRVTSRKVRGLGFRRRGKRRSEGPRIEASGTTHAPETATISYRQAESEILWVWAFSVA